MKQIIVIGERYSTNLGDGVICQCVEKLVNKYKGKEDRVVCWDLSCRKAYGEKYEMREKFWQRIYRRVCSKVLFCKPIKTHIQKRMGTKLYMYWSWYYERINVVKQICKDTKADLVIFAGGELFKDYFLFYIEKYVKLFSRQKAKIWFNACGCDKKNTRVILKRFERVLKNKNVQRTTTRSSFNTCKELFVDSDYIFKPDPVICCADFFEGSSEKNGIGLSIMSLEGINDNKEHLLKFWGEIIQTLRRDNKKFKLFCNGSEEDYVFSKEVLEYTNLSAEYLLPKPYTPEELVKTITSFEKICSFRMHSLIIAYGFGIPFVGLGWDDKLYDFAEYINAEKQVCDWRSTKIADMLAQMDNYCIDGERFNELKSLVYDEFKTYVKGI